jgi:hypothetical protein
LDINNQGLRQREKMEKTKLEERGMTDGDYEDDKAAAMQ